MDEMLTLVLPDGRSARVTAAQARALVDDLWRIGVEAGAPTAATRLVEMLRRPAVLRDVVEFDAREAGPVFRISAGAVAWAPAP